MTRPNVKTLIVAHDSGATGNLFKMNKLFYDCLPRRNAAHAEEQQCQGAGL